MNPQTRTGGAKPVGTLYAADLDPSSHGRLITLPDGATGILLNTTREKTPTGGPNDGVTVTIEYRPTGLEETAHTTTTGRTPIKLWPRGTTTPGNKP